MLPPMLRRCTVRRPPDAATEALSRSSSRRSTALSIRYLTAASSAVLHSMDDLIDHAAMGKFQAREESHRDHPTRLTVAAGDAVIHPTAVIHDGALLGSNVRIGPYSIVGPDVVLEDGVVLQSHVVVDGKTRIGSDTIVHPFACIGGDPQDKKHNELTEVGDHFQLDIGRNCRIREHVTIHRSTSYSSHTPTSLGDNCWILCGAHVAHDAQIGRNVVLSNNVCVAGHVEIGDFAIVGGQVGLKQHVKIGSLAMIGGGSAVDGDVLPYGLASGNRAKLLGLNLVGLRRAKISRHQIKLMLRIVRYLFGSSLTGIAAVCPKTGFAPALDLPYHDSVVLRALEAKRYLADIEITTTSNPFAHEIVDFVLDSPTRPKSSLCSALLH